MTASVRRAVGTARLAEDGHGVADRLDAGHRGAAAGERAQQQPQRQRRAAAPAARGGASTGGGCPPAGAHLRQRR